TQRPGSIHAPSLGLPFKCLSAAFTSLLFFLGFERWSVRISATPVRKVRGLIRACSCLFRAWFAIGGRTCFGLAAGGARRVRLGNTIHAADRCDAAFIGVAPRATCCDCMGT